jgi:beta-ring hydroxylase
LISIANARNRRQFDDGRLIIRSASTALLSVFLTGRTLAYFLARLGVVWRKSAALKMPEATGDIREIVGQPVFVPLYNLFRVYGGVFRLSFGPKSFVVVSEPAVAKQVR